MFHHHLGRIFLALFPTTLSKSKLWSRPPLMGILFFTIISRDPVGPVRLGSIFGGWFFGCQKKYQVATFYGISWPCSPWLLGKKFTKKKRCFRSWLEKDAGAKNSSELVGWWFVKNKQFKWELKNDGFSQPFILLSFFAWGSEATENGLWGWIHSLIP